MGISNITYLLRVFELKIGARWNKFPLLQNVVTVKCKHTLNKRGPNVNSVKKYIAFMVCLRI